MDGCILLNNVAYKVYSTIECSVTLRYLFPPLRFSR